MQSRRVARSCPWRWIPHQGALDLAERYQLSLYDALICAAAQNADAAVLYTEDLRDGLVLGGLRGRNPFVG